MIQQNDKLNLLQYLELIFVLYYMLHLNYLYKKATNYYQIS